MDYFSQDFLLAVSDPIDEDCVYTMSPLKTPPKKKMLKVASMPSIHEEDHTDSEQQSFSKSKSLFM